MAKANTYIVNAYDTDGECILDDLRFTAMTDKAAWSEGIKRAFLKTSERNRQGILGGLLETMTVTRL